MLAAASTCRPTESGGRGRAARVCACGLEGISRELVPKEEVDPRAPPGGRRERRPLAHTPLTGTRHSSRKQRAIRGAPVGWHDLRVWYEHVGVAPALSCGMWGIYEWATCWRGRWSALTDGGEARVATDLIHGVKKSAPLCCEIGHCGHNDVRFMFVASWGAEKSFIPLSGRTAASTVRVCL